MNIQHTGKKVSNLRDLYPGEVFSFRGKLFMKVSDSNENYNAVELLDGTLRALDNFEVEICHGRYVVN